MVRIILVARAVLWERGERWAGGWRMSGLATLLLVAVVVGGSESVVGGGVDGGGGGGGGG